MQLRIEKLVYGGDGLARFPADENGRAKAVFVPFSIDGEEVEGGIVDEKPGFARARIEKIRTPSADRVTPPCPYFFDCGGCQYQHARYQHQLSAKSAILVETLRRTARLELPREFEVHPSPEWNYRNRTRLKVRVSPEFALGYYRSRSHDLLPAEQCPISSLLINRAISSLWETGRRGALASELCELELFANHSDEELLIEAYFRAGAPRNGIRQTCEELAKVTPEVIGVAAFRQPDPSQLAKSAKLAAVGATDLQYRTQSAEYRVSAGAFFQVNRFLIDELSQMATARASGELALDLYAGVGLFSSALAKRFREVIAVESSPTSHADLRRNAPPEVKTTLATTEQFLGEARGLAPDWVVADPPRAGLGENVIRGLARLGSPPITYVSCDPATLARDLRMLSDLGYRITEAGLIDLFPQTFHIESIFHLAAS
ncbi:MAG: class I SAM-dependent RNA methyltransferase [Acidobacteria bacterium]|nr:class I SAM-dependent RNA methyltransferase [Acidobacteriota bacterium]